LSIESVVVDVDLGIEREQIAFRGHDERIDFDQARVLFQKQPIERLRELDELLGLLALEPETECELAALVRLQARGGMNVHPENLLRRMGGDFLDVDAARGRRDEGNAALLTVEHEAQVDLARDFRTGLDVHAPDRQTLGTRLPRDQALSDHRRRGRAHGIEILRELDATRLAASAGVHLRLDHPQRAAQRACGFDRLIRGTRNASARNGDAIVDEDLLGLEFVEVHRGVGARQKRAAILREVG
jgi:hypothetical protein